MNLFWRTSYFSTLMSFHVVHRALLLWEEKVWISKKSTVGKFNIKVSYQYKNSHPISWLCLPYNENTYTGKTVPLYRIGSRFISSPTSLKSVPLSPMTIIRHCFWELAWSLMPPSHCRKFCLRTNTNWHLLRIAQHRIDLNYFVLVRCHFRTSSQANTNVLKCSKHSYLPCESKPIRIALYCIAERRINSCQFLLVRISSLYIHIDSVYIRTGIRRLCAATQYVAIPCATFTLSYWIAHVRIGSCKFLLVPIVFSSHHSAIVLILHHHRTASYCNVSRSCCILLHLTASYQFMFNSWLILIDSQISIISNRSGLA